LDRPVFGGGLVAKLAAELPCVVSLSAEADWPLSADDHPPTNPEVLDVPVAESRVKITRIEKQERADGLLHAKRIVSVGRGLRSQQDLSMIEELASLLDAEVGCSRPISDELHWLPTDRKVGLSGKSVAPDVYLALAISGQIQHLAGIKKAKTIVAINSDREAPIFHYADYFAVADIYTVIPQLIKRLKNDAVYTGR